MTSRDPMRVVERAYDLELPEPSWVEGIVEAAAPLLDTGHGVMGLVADLTAPDGQIVRSPASRGGPPEWQRTWRTGWWDQIMTQLPREAVAAIFSFGPVSYGTHITAGLALRIDTFDQFVEALADHGFEHVFGRRLETRGEHEERPAGFPESLAIIAGDPTGHMVALFGNRPENARRAPGRGIARTWSRVAAHIAAAHRMRRRLGASPPLEGAEAVLTPRGRVVHAEGPAREPAALETIRRAAIGIDRARTARIRGTDEAFELWRAVHEGRWSIADTFDHDGRRFLVVRENEPATDPAPSLTHREQQVVDLLALGHSNKTIAYDLGISSSSVATHLRRAAAKLALSSTRDLVRWARARRRPTESR